jgi:hypothetical protein
MFFSSVTGMVPEKVLSDLEAFEAFCMGEKKLSPEEFKKLNVELSINAVLHIGKHKFRRQKDGQHLIWTDTERREHDLGPVENMNVLRDYPGFNKIRSLALGHDEVAESRVVSVPLLRRQVSVVRMKDGSTGLGPDYKTALRNAALKMKLKRHFNKNSIVDLWSRFSGNA